MTDSERIDKLERIERTVRGRKWWGIANDDRTQPGTILSWAKKRELCVKSVGGIVYSNLRAAIDAAPEPERRKPR